MKKQREYERRQFEVSEIRAGDNGSITGYAAVFNQPARIWSFDEVIRRGAFSKTIQDGADVFAFWNHESGAVLGRTKNGTLRLSEDDHGLRVEIDPPDTPTGQEARALIRDGYVDKMSFGFDVIQEDWVSRGDEPKLREIKEVRLYEVSPVPIPAYDGTVVSARAQARADEPHDAADSSTPEQQAIDPAGPQEPAPTESVPTARESLQTQYVKMLETLSKGGPQ